MHEIYYYEKIAAELMGIQPEQLFEKRKDEEVVLARYLCVYYRREFLHILSGASIKRYGLDHSMAPYVMNTMNNYLRTDVERSFIIRKFISACNSYTSKLIDKPDLKAKTLATEKINTIGFDIFVDRLGKSMYTVMNVIQYENGRNRELRKKCISESIVMLKELYAYYD